MTTTVENTTVYRIRVAYAHTLKEGWRVSETTIEATGTDIDHEQMSREAELVHAWSKDEAQRRNRVEKGMIK